MFPVPPSGGWRDEGVQSIARGDVTDAVAYDLDSETVLGGATARWRPRLTVVCMDHKLTVFVGAVGFHPETGRGATAVQITFDHDPARRETWSFDGAPSDLIAAEPASFMRRLARSKTMTFESTPGEPGATSLTFQTAGFGDARASQLNAWCPFQ